MRVRGNEPPGNLLIFVHSGPQFSADFLNRNSEPQFKRGPLKFKRGPLKFLTVREFLNRNSEPQFKRGPLKFKRGPLKFLNRNMT